ncbi:MAG TPA: HDIG domain-containing protein [Phycisphaerales bacterium]|nr:HDIG domain-containing protein [Phycisphaerales bacterium]
MANTNQFKNRVNKSARRREEIRRTLPRPVLDFAALLRRPEFMTSLLVLACLIAGLSTTVVWSRSQIKLRSGQIVTDTRVNRINYTVIDDAATEARRTEARKAAPRIYNLNSDYLLNLKASLEGLPTAVANQNELETIQKGLVAEFDLTRNPLEPLQKIAGDASLTRDWNLAVARLVNMTFHTQFLLPISEFQEFTTATSRKVLIEGGEPLTPRSMSAIEIPAEPTPEYTDRLRDIARLSGFQQNQIPYVVSKLLKDGKPTILFNSSETLHTAEEQAAGVQPVEIHHHKGDIIYTRGDTLTAEQLDQLETENAQFFAHAPFRRIWAPRFGLIGLMAICVSIIATFTGLKYPRISRNMLRVLALAALLAISFAMTVLVTVEAPIFLFPIAIATTLFTSIIVLIAYDQKLAIVVGAFHAMLNGLALEQSPAFILLLLIGVVTCVFQLREVRHRNSLIRAGTWTAAALGASTILLGVFELPVVPDVWRQIIVLTAAAVAISYGVCFLILGILPTIERLFDITTGMTLAELRDPRQPLLRQLQQRAPGTYNHSLQVANLAESAADAINADSLLVYVGAMYHDIGKMNKPDYFVENQPRGANKHEKLSPAMSLLVIIGHIKDGIELAREYGLPRDIQHFIESHHGTTLVEYFYHVAKTRADESEGPVVNETEYRYPGPKPRTREAAILMLADAVESATRTLAEPNPARIENLVRKLSRKRLDDGQFDECDLTLRQLHLIEEAMIQRLCAIHHSRISYPSSERTEPSEQQPTRPQARPVSA